MDKRIAIIALATFAFGTQTYVFSGLLASLAADLGVSVASAGQLSTAFALVYALAAPLVAGIIAPFERKRIMVGALSALFLINLMGAYAPTFPALLTTRVLAGLVSALITPVAFASAVALTPDALRGRALAVVMAGMTLAFVAGIPLGSVVGDLFGWRATFVFAGLLALVAALGIAAVLPQVPSGERSGMRTLLVAFRPAVLTTLSCSLVAFAGTFSVVAYVGPVVNTATGLTGTAVGAVQFWVGAGGIIGVFMGGYLADRQRSRPTLILGFSFIALTLALFRVVMGPPLAGTSAATVIIGLLFLLSSATMFALGPVIQTRLIRAEPQLTTIVLALNAAFIFVGQGLGAAIGGAVIDRLGLIAVGLVGGAIALGGAAIAAATREPEPATATS